MEITPHGWGYRMCDSAKASSYISRDEGQGSPKLGAANVVRFKLELSGRRRIMGLAVNHSDRFLWQHFQPALGFSPRDAWATIKEWSVLSLNRPQPNKDGATARRATAAGGDRVTAHRRARQQTGKTVFQFRHRLGEGHCASPFALSGELLEQIRNFIIACELPPTPWGWIPGRRRSRSDRRRRSPSYLNRRRD